MTTNVLVSSSGIMREALQVIERIAPTDVNVVIIGEHGSGKEWAAHLIHSKSPRSAGPFHTLDCAAVPPESIEQEAFGCETISWDGISIRRGAFEEAAGGTLHIDEMQALPSAIQMKIARAIEYKTVYRIGSDRPINVDARIITSVTRSANQPSQERQVIDEALFRIGPIVLDLPPLRDRREDITSLVESFLAEFRRRGNTTATALSEKALGACIDYDWPGNVRHLKNAVEFAAVMCQGDQLIQTKHLPDYLQKTVSKIHSSKP